MSLQTIFLATPLVCTVYLKTFTVISSGSMIRMSSGANKEACKPVASQTGQRARYATWTERCYIRSELDCCLVHTKDTDNLAWSFREFDLLFSRSLRSVFSGTPDTCAVLTWSVQVMAHSRQPLVLAAPNASSMLALLRLWSRWGAPRTPRMPATLMQHWMYVSSWAVCSCSASLPRLTSALWPEASRQLPTRSRPRTEFCVQRATRYPWRTVASISTVAARSLFRQAARSLCTTHRGARPNH